MRNDEPIELSPKAFALLSYLVERDGKLATKQELLDDLWADVSVSEAVIKVAIAEVRRALGDNARKPRFIETVQRGGYRFIADVEIDRAAPPAATARPPGQTPQLIGRAAPIALLKSHLTSALAAQRQTVFVTGEAGIGKTALLEAFITYAHEDGVRVVVGHCRERFGEGEAFLPLFELLGALCRDTDDETAREILRRHCPSWLAEIPWLQHEVDAAEEPDLGAKKPSRARMLREIVDGFEAIAGQQPLVLIFEDLHWSDPSTVDALSALSQRTEPARLMIIGSYRQSEVRLTDHPIQNLRDRITLSDVGHELALGPLKPDDVESFVATRLGGDAPDDVGQLLFRRSEGNPLFMNAFLDQLLTHRYLETGQTGWQLRHSLDEIDSRLPEKLRGVLSRQIEHLPPERIRILECASVFGREFDGAMISAALDAEHAVAEETLDGIAQQDAVLRVVGTTRSGDRPATGQYAFAHVLLRQAVYERIGPARRAELHVAVASELEKRHATPAELAFHFNAAGLIEKAILAWEQAGTLASEQWAMREAVEHFERALEALAQLPGSADRDKLRFGLLVKLGGPVSDVYGPGSPRLAEIYRDAEALSEQLDETVELVPMLAGLFTYRIGRAQHREAEELAARIMAIVEPLGVELLLESAFLVTGIAKLYRGKFAEAIQSMDQGLTLSSDEVVYNWGQDARALSYMFSAFAAHVLGSPDDAKARAEKGIACARLGTDAHLITVTAQFDSILARWQGDIERAQQRALFVNQVSEENGLELWKPVTGWVLGWVATQQGDAEVGLAEMQAHLDHYEESGTKASRTDYLAATAEACGRQGQIEGGLELIREALDTIATTGEHIAEAEVHRVRGALLHRRASSDGSDFSAANAAMERAFNLARAQGAVAWSLRTAIQQVRLAADERQAANARSAISSLLAENPELARLPEAAEFAGSPSRRL